VTARSFSAGHVVALVERATRPVPLLWPLGSAVAVNPLWDLRGLPFPTALAHARRTLGIAGLPSADVLADAIESGRITVADLEAALEDRDRLAAVVPDVPGPPEPCPMVATVLERHEQLVGSSASVAVDREVAKYCAAYVGGLLPGPATGATGFFATWRSAVEADPASRRLGLDELLGSVTGSPEAVIATVLARLGLDEPGAVDELTGQSTRLPGWAAHAKWRSRWAAPDYAGPALDLVDYLAVRLVYDLAALVRLGHRRGDGSCCDHVRIAAPGSPPVPSPGIVGGRTGERLAELDPDVAGVVWLAAYEGHYRDELLARLRRHEAPAPARVPLAQVVCCIDARSEGLRRHLEALGDYDTFGFAGFFGVPARVWPFAGTGPVDLLPVLLHPSVELAEQAADDAAGDARLAGLRQLASVERAVTSTREGAVTPYLLAEAAGLGLGPLAVLRTVAPTRFGRLRRRVVHRFAPPVDVHPDLDGTGAPDDAEQALFVETMLRTIGLTDGFAPVVVLCGHGSTTENNPYGSALDCGACGAARGATSARVAAAMANRPGVRALLAERGVVVPAETVFVAAEHDTATDTVSLFPPVGLSPADRERLARVGWDLARAGAALAEERAATLPGTGRRSRRWSVGKELAMRSTDWAQVQPEWGLARCAGFVIGPRRLTAGVDLQRRAFLHSYEPDTDPDGTALESILTGPMVVAQWISAAYYHSAVDPDVLGAGDKVAHNVVAGIGVYQGAGGDLRLGLPRQAVFDRTSLYHEPMRLLVVVAAPRERVDAVVARNPVVAELADGEWVHLAVRDGERTWLREPGGSWRPWLPRRGNGQPPAGTQGAIRAHDHGETRAHDHREEKARG
jgi:uncharacterized protein YbcC (UPF0753/DUF2309 family)